MSRAKLELTVKSSITRKNMLTDILTRHANNGGSTTLLNGTIPTHGYAVAYPNDDRFQVVGRLIPARTMAEYIARNAARDNVDAIGTWYDVDANASMAELVTITDNVRHALMLGRERNQKAIFDLANRRDIVVPTNDVDVNVYVKALESVTAN